METIHCLSFLHCRPYPSQSAPDSWPKSYSGWELMSIWELLNHGRWSCHTPNSSGSSQRKGYHQRASWLLLITVYVYLSVLERKALDEKESFGMDPNADGWAAQQTGRRRLFQRGDKMESTTADVSARDKQDSKAIVTRGGEWQNRT